MNSLIQKRYRAVDDNQPEKTHLPQSANDVYSALRELLRPYEDDLAVKTDRPGHYYLETRSPSFNGRRLFFAAAKVKKRYVSFYLPALYMFPELSNTISPGLRKKLQGHSCFNFTAVDQDSLEELTRLTRAGFFMLKSRMLL